MNIFNFFTPKSETFYLNVNSTLRQALEKFDFHKFTVISLVDDDGKFVSTVSEGDILRHIKNVLKFDLSSSETIRLKDIDKYRSYKPLNINAPLDDAFKLSLDQNFIPLVDDRGTYIGILKRKTIISFLLDNKK